MVEYAGSFHHEKPGRVPLFVHEHFPALYEPEPEIFFERITGVDGSMYRDRVVAYPDLRHPTKILFNVDSAAAHAAPCGPGGQAAPGVGHVHPLGWRYIDGPSAPSACRHRQRRPAPRARVRTAGDQPFARSARRG